MSCRICDNSEKEIVAVCPYCQAFFCKDCLEVYNGAIFRCPKCNRLLDVFPDLVESANKARLSERELIALTKNLPLADGWKKLFSQKNEQ